MRHSAVMAYRINDQQAREVLAAGTHTGKLATVRANGSPHVAPVWFVLDGDDLVFTTGQVPRRARPCGAIPGPR
jgi:nitroimidazol reductase NimA-like FMN-containing flavoprotein (pyridoxamine 5'-phosphate oxidase superfamily)